MNARICKTLIVILALTFGLGSAAWAQEVILPTTGNGITPVLVEEWTSGNAEFECSQTDCDSPYAYKIDWIDGQSMNDTYSHAGNTITIANDDGYTFNWTSDFPVCAVIVKASTKAYVYYYGGYYGDTGLVAPEGKGISHATFCFGEPTGQKCATICGIKFHDRDADGERQDTADPKEELLQGWTIKLSKWDGDNGWEWVSTAETDENGAYCFTVYEAGDYKVEEVLQSGWAQTAEPGTFSVELGDDPACCASYPGNDFGNIKLGSITACKFKDCDADGVWDDGEVGIQGWTITLAGEDVLERSVEKTATTNAEGCVVFADLWPGQYAVCEEERSNWDAITPTCSGPIMIPTPLSPSTTWSLVECVPPTTYVYDWTVDPFGNIPLGSITACKFYDYDKDGINDGPPSEGPVPGVQFDLYQNWKLVASGVTGEDGCVEFANLRTGPSYVYTLKERLDLLKGKWEATTPTKYEFKLACEENASVTKCFGNFKWSDETAWAANGDVPLQLPYIGADNWATYVEYYDVAKTTTLFAGQTMDAGWVTFSAPDVNGQVTITITLNDGWAFFEEDENIKVQDYATAPEGNPAPGLFAHKTEAPPAEITVPQNKCYGVHVDLLTDVPVPYSKLKFK